MRVIVAMLLPCLGLVSIAEARMYQWTNPESGNVQLAGKPPAWYRGEQAGPRVFVFDNGELVDDTAVPVSETQRLELRARAFEDGSAAELASPEEQSRGELRDALARAQEAGVDVAAVTTEFEAERQAAAEQAAAEAAPDADEGERVAELKSLIEAFDQRRLEQARALLQLLPEVATTPAE